MKGHKPKVILGMNIKGVTLLEESTQVSCDDKPALTIFNCYAVDTNNCDYHQCMLHSTRCERYEILWYGHQD